MVINALQIEFLSQDETVDVIPLADIQRLPLLSGDIGPFKAGRPATMPVWLALSLKRKGMCRVRPPAWLDRAVLAATLESERAKGAPFSDDLPFYWLPIAYQLFEHAPDEIRDLDQVRGLVEDIRAARASKVRDGLLALREGEEAVKLRNLSAAEIGAARPFVTGVLARLHALSKASAEADAASASRAAQQSQMEMDAAAQEEPTFVAAPVAPSRPQRFLRPVKRDANSQ